MPFEFQKLSIADVILVKPKVFNDERGYFLETFKHSDFFEAGIKQLFVQDNCSRSEKGVLRGLHFQQNPSAQGKLVYCIKGEIFDVAVDIRKGSPMYGKWVSAILSEENKNMLYIPSGFAHGFCVISEYSYVIYKCTEEYSPDDDSGIIWNDPEIGIEWPVSDPILSEKDNNLKALSTTGNNFEFK